MKLKSFLKFIILIIGVCQFSCRKDFSTVSSNGNLTFSADTLFLDTVFSNLSSNTNILKVYNTSKEDIVIPKIQLEKSNSKYRINVDGVSGTTFENTLLLKKDSLYIRIEVTADASETDSEMVYRDRLLFDPEGTQQDVKLATLVKDATFLFSSTSADFNLATTTLTNTKPYVIYGNAIVPENGNLTINAGTHVYFSKNASLTIAQGATLNINGTLTDSIVFSGDNLNSNYDGVPGQWQGINIKNTGSVNINYLRILNPTTALNITDNTNPITLKNTEIYNAAQHGIYTKNANITGQNIVVGQTGKSSLYLQGGNYTFEHCTFANFWSKGIRIEKTLTLTNYFTDDEGLEIKAPLNSANFRNCIITGNKTSELFLDKSKEEPKYVFNLKNCMLKINENGDDLYDTKNALLYTNTIFNKKEDFKNVNSNDFRIGLENEGIDKADMTTANNVVFDILGNDRTTNPDIGAYQHIDFITLEEEYTDE